MMLTEKYAAQKFKYLWYSATMGPSDDFDTEEECILDAYKENIENPSEYGIYSYDSLKYPNGDIDIDDCNYLRYVGNEVEL